MGIITILALFIYTLSLFFCIYINNPKKKSDFFAFKHFFLISFLLIFSIYVYPLSLFYISGEEASGDVSQDIYKFGGYIPFSIILSSLFIVILSLIFKKWNNIKFDILPKVELNKHDKLILLVLLIICVFMLISLGQSAGGLLLLVLKGYSVTELFIGKGHLAVAFEWMSTILLLYLSNDFLTKKKKYIAWYLFLLFLLILIFSIMGRRSAIVVLIGSLIMNYNLLYKRIKFLYLMVLAVVGFLFLTYVGFLRGQSFEDISSGIESMQKKSDALSHDENADILYTLKTGNFAVPFETLPRIISVSGDNYFLGFGYYSLSSIFNIIPIAVWESRPLPLSNWYMREFYGVSNLNEGRQFFLLTAPYMDFGPFGIILFAVFMGYLFLKINYLVLKNSQNVLIITLISLFYGSLMNMISNDFLGFLIAFIKGYAFPILIIMIINFFLKIFSKV